MNMRYNKIKNVRRKMRNRIIVNLLFIIFSIFVSLPIVNAAASFAVNSFSCTPTEVSINGDFSCTAQIINNGDAAGTVSVATLFSDSNNWLEQSTYAQASGVSVDPGQTTEVTFSGLRATKSGGSNGFSKITLDSATDTNGVDGVTVNIIDVAVTLSNSVSSKAASQSFDTTAEVTAGGNIDVTLTFAVSSGGCSIGNQASTKSVTGMTHNDRQSRSWTVTMGTTGDCIFTISASATGTAGVATKTDSASSTITCSSGCSSGSTSTSSGTGGGGGGGGGVGKLIKSIGEISTPVEQEIGKGEFISFTFGSVNHSISVTNLTEVTASIIVRSTEKTFTLTVGEEKIVDFDDDGKNDISIKLKSINILKKQALLIINPLYAPSMPAKAGEGKESEAGGVGGGGEEGTSGEGEGETSKGKSILKIVLILVIIIVIAILAVIVLKSIKKKRHLHGY